LKKIGKPINNSFFSLDILPFITNFSHVELEFGLVGNNFFMYFQNCSGSGLLVFSLANSDGILI